MTGVDDRTIFLAIHPRHAQAILDGAKTVELRRTPPRIVTPTLAFLYASSPVRAVVGTCRVAFIETMSVNGLWRNHGGSTGVSKAEYLRYFEGLEQAHALHIEAASRLPNPVTLDCLPENWHGFHPPQSFRYLSPDHLRTLTLAA